MMHRLLLLSCVTTCLSLAPSTEALSQSLDPAFASQAPFPWPAAVRDPAHTIGYNFLQFREYGLQAPAHFHGATDIVMVQDGEIYAPTSGKLEAGYFRYRHLPSGHVERYESRRQNREDFEVVVIDQNGYRFELRHVAPESLTPAVEEALQNGGEVAARTLLGRVSQWEGPGPDGGDFTHIHYRIVAPDGTLVNPEAVSPPLGGVDTVAPDIVRIITHYEDGQVGEFDQGLYGPDLREIVLEVKETRGQNVYQQVPLALRATIDERVIAQWDFRETLRLPDGRKPSIWDIFKKATRTAQGTIMRTVGTHQKQQTLLRVLIPPNTYGELTITIEDQAGNETRLVGNISMDHPRFADREAPSLPDVGPCREHIAKAICLVDPPADPDNPGPRTCLAGGEAYVSRLQGVFDAVPPVLQRVFCSLSSIYIENRLFGTAYAGIRGDAAGRIIGAELGLRRSILDHGMSFDEWSTWKEQLSFGADREVYEVLPNLPVVTTGHPDDDFLVFLLSHEFGHIIDQMNQANQYVDCRPETGCTMVAGSFGAISWETDLRSKAEETFVAQEGLCFYRCDGGFIEADLISPLYQGFAATGFVSLYGATEPDEDFAETLALYLYGQRPGARYVVTLPDGGRYDLLERLDEARIESKVNYIRRLIESPYLRYPPLQID